MKFPMATRRKNPDKYQYFALKVSAGFFGIYMFFCLCEAIILMWGAW